MWRYVKSDFECALFTLLNKSLGKITRRFIEHRIVKAKVEIRHTSTFCKIIVMVSNRTKAIAQDLCISNFFKDMSTTTYIIVMDFQIFRSFLLSFWVQAYLILLHFPLLHLQILHFLQTKGLWQSCSEQGYQ